MSAVNGNGARGDSGPRRQARLDPAMAAPAPPHPTLGPVVVELRFPGQPGLRADLSGYPRPAIARALVAALVAQVQVGGGIGRRGTAISYLDAIRSFLTYLATLPSGPERLADLRTVHLDDYEAALRERYAAGSIRPYALVSRVVVLLRACADTGRVLDAGLRARLAYAANAPKGRGAGPPLDAYSGAVAARLRAACRRDIGALLRARERGEALLGALGFPTAADWLRGATPGSDSPSRGRVGHPTGTGEQCPAPTPHQVPESREAARSPLPPQPPPPPPPALGTADPLAAWVERMATHPDGFLPTKDFPRSADGGPSARIEAQRLLYPSSAELLPFILLLILESGIEPECCLTLPADCLRNPNDGLVTIVYTKHRAHGHAARRLPVQDGHLGTPGRLIALARWVTEHARRRSGQERLWVCFSDHAKKFLTLHAESVQDALPGFIRRHDLRDDDGRPLAIDLRRLRKTRLADRYRLARGQMDDFARGHTKAVAARHYADIPALRGLHEDAAAAGLQAALDAALPCTVLTEDEERAIASVPSATISGAGTDFTPEETAGVLSGAHDVWLAGCRNFFDSPFGQRGKACPVPFFGCLECANAVITRRKLPAIFAFLAFIEADREATESHAWEARYGRAYRRIVEQILPRFPEEERTAARLVAAMTPGLIYMPPTGGNS